MSPSVSHVADEGMEWMVAFQAQLNAVFRPYLRLHEPLLYTRLKTALTRLKTKLDPWIASEDREFDSRYQKPPSV
jgi:hypothetical protein